MANYLDREEFHAEMTKCKRQDALTNKAIVMLNTLATEVSRRYYFEHEEDYQDASQQAMYDLLKYWRGFKENAVVRLPITRNFVAGEIVTIKMDRMEPVSFMATTPEKLGLGEPRKDGVTFLTKPGAPTLFYIGETANKSLMNLATICKELHGKYLGVFLDRVKCIITFMDNLNLDPDYTTYNSSVEFTPVAKGETLAYDEAGKVITDSVKVDGKMVKTKRLITGLLPISDAKFNLPHQYRFKKSPNSFSYFTSVCNNGVLKYIDVRNPKALRNGNLVTRSESTFFNI